MKILIAGGNGFIGTYLFSQLAEKVSITSIDYNQDIIDENFSKLDLTNIDQVNHFVENCFHFDTLIFLVGLTHNKGKSKNLHEFKKVNYQTLVNLLSALEDSNKVPNKIVFASTISVYGERYNQSSYDEDLEPIPFSPYAVTKLQAEQYLLNNFRNRSWILRFAPVYSSDFLLNVNRRTKIKGGFYRVGAGDKKLSLCNIENIGAAIEAIISRNIPTCIYNLSDPTEYTFNELLMWRNAEKFIQIPQFAVKLFYYLGKFINNTFIKENTVKLISDNIFPSEKIRSFVDLPATLNDVQIDYD
mgnify:CR=1 FL=1